MKMANSSIEDIAETHAGQNCILVAVDFSEDSRAAAVWAGRHATMTQQPLAVLHVVHDMASSPGFYQQQATEPLQPLEDIAEKMMEDFLGSILNDHPELSVLGQAEKHFVPGLPAGRIVEVSKLLGASLLVIGGTGFGSQEKARLGSVAKKVVKISTTPVVVIRSENARPNKNDSKKEKKQLKKERKRLKKLLGLN
jgi:nucleotide-binding universal stress UspA family protein